MSHVILYINKEDEFGYVEQTSFSVPKDWLENILENEYETTLDEFMSEYTSFESEEVLMDAEEAGVAIH